jgi:YaiO family outer membrane protein
MRWLPALCIAPTLVAPTAFACDPALQAIVAEHPERSDDRDSLARSCARAGRPADALFHYDVLLQVDAGNSDWLLGKSQALIALGRASEALPLLERGRAVAPAYEDVWRSNVIALESLDEFDRADALLAEAASAFPQSDWPASRRQALEERRLLERGTRLSVDFSYEDLSGGRDPWKGATIGIDKRVGADRRVLAGMHIEERFDTQDEQLALGYVQRVNDDWSFSMAGDVAPDAEVLPEWSLVAEVGRALPGGRSLGLRARHASYQDVDVDSLAATFEQYFERFRVAYTLNAAKPTDISTSFGHALRFAHDYARDSHVTLVLGFGEEAETVAPGVVQVTDVRSVALHGVHWRSAAWGFAWEAGWHEQGDLYDRIRIRLGFERRL